MWGDRMKRLLLAVLLLAAGCQYEHMPFGAESGYVACVLSGIDAEGKADGDVSALGLVSVRVGNCNGPAVNASVWVAVRLWVDLGPANMLCSDDVQTGPNLEAAVALAESDIEHASYACWSADTEDSPWRAETWGWADLFGVRYYSSHVYTEWEFRS